MSEKYSNFVSEINSKIAAEEAKKADSDNKVVLVKQRSKRIVQKLKPHFKKLSTELFEKIDEPFGLSYKFLDDINQYKNGHNERENVRYTFFVFSIKRPDIEMIDRYYFSIISGFPINEYSTGFDMLVFGATGKQGILLNLFDRKNDRVTTSEFEQIVDDYKNGILPEFIVSVPEVVDGFVLNVLKFYQDFEGQNTRLDDTKAWDQQFVTMYNRMKSDLEKLQYRGLQR